MGRFWGNTPRRIRETTADEQGSNETHERVAAAIDLELRARVCRSPWHTDPSPKRRVSYRMKRGDDAAVGAQKTPKRLQTRGELLGERWRCEKATKRPDAQASPARENKTTNKPTETGNAVAMNKTTQINSNQPQRRFVAPGFYFEKRPTQIPIVFLVQTLSKTPLNFPDDRIHPKIVVCFRHQLGRHHFSPVLKPCAPIVAHPQPVGLNIPRLSIFQHVMMDV